MKILRIVWVVLAIAALASAASAQDADGEKPEEDPRRQILLYGIETDVLTVLGDLERDKISAYNDLLTELISETKDPEISQGIFRVWQETEYSAGLVFGREELTKVVEDYDYAAAVVRASMAYLAELNDGEAVSTLLEIVDHRDIGLAAAAVRALGKIDRSDPGITYDLLVERLEDVDPLAEEDLTAALIVSLGQLAYTPAAEELALIAEDAGSSQGHRRLACVALGQIGRPEDYAIVENLYYESDDAMLRSYALAGLAEFDDHDSTSILVQALKRDPFWRIRVTAAEKLIGNSSSAVQELLRYKAGNDPVNHVRVAAMKALGASSDRESERYLIDYFGDDSKSADTRLAALDALVVNEVPGTVEAVEAVMEDLWEKDQGRFLEYTCRNLSLAEWPRLAPVYEKMLDHSNWLLVVYGIRGIRRNGIGGLQGRIAELDVDGTDIRIRRVISLEQ